MISFLLCQVADIIKIQSFWRAKKAKQDYKQLGESFVGHTTELHVSTNIYFFHWSHLIKWK